MEHIGHVIRMSVSGYRYCWFEPISMLYENISMLCPGARHFIHIVSVDSAVKRVPGLDTLVKDVQCYELFGRIALKKLRFIILVDLSSLSNYRF